MQIYNVLLDNGYTKREQQEKMFEIINNYIIGQKPFIILIEAPTGTGKSFGYLMPIIENKQKAIISTRTKILQEQIRNDIEYLSSLHTKLYNKPINYVVVKGKANYLCLDRFYRQYKPENKQKLFSFQKNYNENNNKEDYNNEIANMIYDKDWDGDKEFINVNQKQWTEINIDEDYCTPSYRKICPYYKRCYYYSKLKTKEKESDIIIVNHNLLPLKEFEKRGKILIIDEAHELDEALISSMTRTISVNNLIKITSEINSLYSKINVTNKSNIDNALIISTFASLFASYFKYKKNNSVPLDEPFFVDLLLNTLIIPIMKTLDNLSNNIKEYVQNELNKNIMYNINFITYNLMQESGIFKEKEMNKYSGDLTINPTEIDINIQNILLQYAYVKNCIENIKNLLEKAKNSNENYPIRYSVQRELINYTVEIFPIFSHNLLNLEGYNGVILTSATLDEDLINLTTGIKGEYFVLGHTFDYANVKFIIRKTNPQDENWNICIQESLEYLKKKYEKVLVLLTNVEHMEYILRNDNIVFQNETPLKKAIELIKDGSKNVLVGVDSLWTGIDIKGEKGILMSKLPFDSPSNPLHHHRIRYFKSNKINDFIYSKKRAFIKFKQGFGRLVRSHNDSGTIIICDDRILRYKEFINFIKSLNIKIYYK